MEVESAGKLPKGAKAFVGKAKLNDSASGSNDAYMILESAASKEQAKFQLGYVVPDDRIQVYPFDVPADANGDLYHRIEATGSSTLDATITINAVRVN
jgi:hypothetical protein